MLEDMIYGGDWDDIITLLFWAYPFSHTFEISNKPVSLMGTGLF